MQPAIVVCGAVLAAGGKWNNDRQMNPGQYCTRFFGSPGEGNKLTRTSGINDKGDVTSYIYFHSVWYNTRAEGNQAKFLLLLATSNLIWASFPFVTHFPIISIPRHDSSEHASAGSSMKQNTGSGIITSGFTAGPDCFLPFFAFSPFHAGYKSNRNYSSRGRCIPLHSPGPAHSCQPCRSRKIFFFKYCTSWSDL